MTWMHRYTITTRAEARDARVDFRRAGRHAALVVDRAGKVRGHVFAAAMSGALFQNRELPELIRWQAGAMIAGDAYRAKSPAERRQIIAGLRGFRLGALR